MYKRQDVKHCPLARLAEELLALQHTVLGRRGSERPPRRLVADTVLVSQVTLDPSLDVAMMERQAVQCTQKCFYKAEIRFKQLSVLCT